MTSDNDDVLDARLDLMRREAVLAVSQRTVELADLLAMAAATIAGIVIAPVVALEAASSSSEFSVGEPWNVLLPISAVAIFVVTLVIVGAAFYVRSNLESAAKEAQTAREHLMRVERAAEHREAAEAVVRAERLAVRPASADTFWAWLRARFIGS